MKSSTTKPYFLILLEFLCQILPTLFWLFVLFSFEEASLAITTLLCALIHEVGHMVCIIVTQGSDFSLRGVLNGFRIKPNKMRSYDDEILIYLSGPLSNIFALVLCIILSITVDRSFFTAALINLATALSNLIPIKGYDGYGALRAFIRKREGSDGALKALSIISSALVFAFCIFSIYLIDRYNGGYWIFVVFFVSMVKELEAGLGEHFSRFKEI